MKKSIRVCVPATTANIGPGFDTLGIALQMYNHVDLTLMAGPQVVFSKNVRTGQGHDAMKMVREASRSFFQKIQSDEHGVAVHIHGDIPIARGLGSSVTVRLGVIAGLNRLCGSALEKDEVLNLVAKLEGHPDNAAPALYGGLVVSGMIGNRVTCFHKKLPNKLKFVAAIPGFEVKTEKARALLPSTLPFADAVHNTNRVAMLVAAFWNGDYKAVGDFFEDRLHQPFRVALIPQLFSVLNAARCAGAIGGWLSGSGSTIMAMTLSNEEKIGKVMTKVFEKSGVACKILILRPADEGILLRRS